MLSPAADPDNAPPRALYVHTPMCATVCGYCDFYSVVFDRRQVVPLVGALLCELAAEVTHAPGSGGLETIFVGGGTPTVLPPAELGRLLAACRALAAPAALEFTVEANPATVRPAAAQVLAEAGVTRVSIGAQSFDLAELRVLERTHRPEQVGHTVAACRAAGIGQINLDLIFGIPGQTLASWRASLEAALALDPDHLSCYGLTYEPGTPLFAQRAAGHVQPVDPDLEADLYELTIEVLAGAGYGQYELSNFARPGAECRHNLVYWRNEPYLGIGPSAAGFVAGVRYKNVADLHEYVARVRAGRSPRAEAETLNPAQRARETAMLGLRLTAGLERGRFAARFGVDPAEFFAPAVAAHVADGLLEVTPEALRLTRRGRLLADTVIADFVASADAPV